MERRLSSYHPRKNWNFSSVPVNDSFKIERDASGDFSQIDLTSAGEIGALHIQRLFARTIDSLFHRGWTLFKQPVAVEVISGDLPLSAIVEELELVTSKEACIGIGQFITKEQKRAARNALTQDVRDLEFRLNR
jgi:hypothetical protein